MSIVCSTSEQICHSPTNNSKSKMLYSFGRSSRFPLNKQNQCNKFYEINKCRQERATAFGYGMRYDFTIDGPKTPPPGSYEPLSIFGEAKKNNKGFGFGIGRSEMKSTGSLNINTNPGPGTYKLVSNANNIYSSLKGKGKVDNRQISYKPGPGAYETIQTFNKTGSGYTFFSKFKNKSACKFSKQEKLKMLNNKVPGPGSYDMSKTQFSPEGKYFYSRLQSAKGNKFGKSLRLSPQSRCKTPGPGNYRLPTEFGYYRSKHAKEEQEQSCKNKTISYDFQ